MGYDPMMQVIHFDDGVRALAQALTEDHQGVFNVAASPPLPLMKIIRMSGGRSAPILHPFAYTGQSIASMLFRKGKEIPAIPWDFLRYPWTASTDRIEAEWGYHPRQDAETTVRRFAEERHAGAAGHATLESAAAKVGA
jgi:nucleoside-diphosphate-sugar epimerase